MEAYSGRIRKEIDKKEVNSMEEYRIYVVYTAKFKPGKRKEALKWWQEKGKAFKESFPGTKSVRAYAVQFRLGGEYYIEIWAERENYASFDLLDKEMEQNPQKYSPIREATDLFDWGPTRIMGDWPESMFIPE
jgi:TPR repeat protein